MFDYNSGCFFLTNFGDFLLTRNGYNRLTLTPGIGAKNIDSKYDIDFYGTNKNYFDFAKANEEQKKEIVVAFADEINCDIEEFLKNLENK